MPLEFHNNPNIDHETLEGYRRIRRNDPVAERAQADYVRDVRQALQFQLPLQADSRKLSVVRTPQDMLVLTLRMDGDAKLGMIEAFARKLTTAFPTAQAECREEDSDDGKVAIARISLPATQFERRHDISMPNAQLLAR